MSRVLAAVVAASTVAALTGCGGSTAPTTTVTPTATVPAPTPSPEETSAPAVPSWTMPNLVGANLQDAQDTIQRITDNGITITTSHDATGGGRMQVLDRNWKVCSQNVAPGKRITPATRIDFGAVKNEENC